jgi:hypothetical protein
MYVFLNNISYLNLKTEKHIARIILQLALKAFPNLANYHPNKALCLRSILWVIINRIKFVTLLFLLTLIFN